MKYFILLALVSIGCLTFLCLSVDFKGLADIGFSTTASQDSDIDGALTPTSASRSDEPSNLNSGLIESDGSELVLMKFGAPWCPPCRMVDKELRKLERSSLPVEIRKIDVDERPEMASRYGVTNIPRLILLQDGRKVGDLVGYRSADDLAKWIKNSASAEALAGKKSNSNPSAVHANPFVK
ncbi:MAG: thioredoxin family protein [Planctomycetales bacterium]|nr:thioredoxin family protein [Planctomycetales bacterium]